MLPEKKVYKVVDQHNYFASVGHHEGLMFQNHQNTISYDKDIWKVKYRAHGRTITAIFVLVEWVKSYISYNSKIPVR